MLALIIVWRMTPVAGGKLPGRQNAYQRLRSAEIMLSDLDRSASGNREGEKYTYMVGLAVAGAFDSASLSRLTGTLIHYAVPGSLTRFISTWLTYREFRVRLATPLGAVPSEYHNPLREYLRGRCFRPPFVCCA